MWCVMKVQSSNIPNKQPMAAQHLPPSFRGKADWRKVSKEISNNSKFVSKALTYLGQNDGEILNTVVTAVGTAVIAPLFIAGNPISKEDKETKWYSALRQPISAFIALVVQLYVNKQFNNWVAQQASTGAWGEFYDLRALPKESYLKRIIKLEHPEFNKEQIKAEILKRQSAGEKTVVNDYRNKFRDKPVEWKELLSKDALDDARKDLKKDLEKTYKDELKGKNPVSAEKFINEKLSAEIIEQRALSDIQKLVETDAKAKFQIRDLAKKFSTVDDAIKHMTEQLGTSTGDKELIQNILDRLENTKSFEQSKGMKAFSSIRDLGKTYEEVLHNVKIKKMVKAKVSDAHKAVGKANKTMGIVVSLVTLPFSCGLLNWAYPRVMEKVMPKIQPWIHRNDKDWTPEKAKKYGPPEKIEKQVKTKNVKEEDDD